MAPPLPRISDEQILWMDGYVCMPPLFNSKPVVLTQGCPATEVACPTYRVHLVANIVA